MFKWHLMGAYVQMALNGCVCSNGT